MEASTLANFPPGPRLPRIVQTAGFMFDAPRFLTWCRRRYGNVVSFSTLFDSRFVIAFDPASIKQVFQGKPEQLRAGGPTSSGQRDFEERRRRVDELIYDEIARRRRAPDLEEREDVFSMLLLARDEDGNPMTDEEVRDELVTLLVAGHETTAPALA